MVDRMLKRYGVGWALALLVLELTYINAKSLHYLVQGLNLVDMLFGVVGAIAYSMVTVLVMRLSSRTWLKLVFPLFDVALVLLGFNLRFADDLLGNPVRFWLTVFIALFTGLITYSLGQINAEQHTEDKDTQRINELISKLHAEEVKHSDTLRKLSDTQAKLNELTSLHDETKRMLNDTQKQLSESVAELNQTRRKHDELIGRIKSYDAIAERNAYLESVTRELLRSHILYEAWVSTKRREKSEWDMRIQSLAQQLKQGRDITLEEFNNIKSYSNGSC